MRITDTRSDRRRRKVVAAVAIATVGSGLALAGTAPVGAQSIGAVTPMAVAGGRHTAVLTSSGTVLTMGSNEFGALGVATNSGTTTATPTPQDTTITGAVDVAAGLDHTVVVKDDGTVLAFGINEFGQLGSATNNGTGTPNPTPTAVAGITDAVAAAGGEEFTLVLKEDGTLVGFGDNFFGQLGNATNNGNATANPTPAAATVLTDVVDIAAGSHHSLALKADGTVWSFGRNTSGQLGLATNAGNNNANPTPTQVPGLSGIVDVEAGASHSVVLRSDGTVWTFGENERGQLGNATNNGNTNENHTPTQVSGLSGIVDIAAAATHTVVLRNDGTVWGFGLNTFGQLGTTTNNGNSNANPAPAQATGLSGVAAIDTGSTGTLALAQDGNLWAFGVNSLGQFGTPHSGDGNPFTAFDTTVDATRSLTGSAARRLRDTRSNGTTVDGQEQGGGKVAAGSTTEVVVAGRGNVPATASAAVLNVTVTEGTGAGFMTVFPCGADRPLASNLNYVTGQTVANMAVSQIGTGGKVCVYNEGATAHLVVDVDRFFDGDATFDPMAPKRIVDTRSDGVTVDGQDQAGGIRTTGTTMEVTVTGRATVSATAKAVVLNVTVTAPTGLGFVTVFPCGSDRPLASNLNYNTAQTVANLVMAQIGDAGKVCIYNEGASAHLVVDVMGTYDGAAPFWTQSPKRLLDTRSNGVTVDGVSQAGGIAAAGSTTEVVVAGRGTVPPGAELAVLNLTTTGGGGTGFLTVFPCGQSRPLTSNLNYSAGQTVANAVIARIGDAGKVCIYNEGAATHLVLDVNGSVTA
ncbi:MAG: RCC1 domain-containing protein [Acidimicrobiia bacterium]